LHLLPILAVLYFEFYFFGDFLDPVALEAGAAALFFLGEEAVF